VVAATARQQGEAAIAAYKDRMTRWLRDGAAFSYDLCGRGLVESLVRLKSEQAHVLAVFPPMALSLVMPTYVKGLKVVMEGYVCVHA
jgi:hypothetical protein